MGTILGDMFKKVGGGLGKVFDGDIIDGVGDVLDGVIDAGGRTVKGALSLVGLDDGDMEPGAGFIYCEVAILAKMAKTDGRVTKSEISFLNSIFDDLELDAETKQSLQEFANEQKKTVSDIFEFAAAAAQFAAKLSPEDEGVEIRLALYRNLFLMALADQELNEKEIEVLRAILDPLGLKDEAFDYMLNELPGGGAPADDATLAEAYATLGVSPDASDAAIKKAYLKKIAAFHPDKIQGKDLDPEWLELANQQSAKINQAYETIKATRRTNQGEPTMKKATTKKPAPKARKKTETIVCPHCGECFDVSANGCYICPECEDCVEVSIFETPAVSQHPSKRKMDCNACGWATTKWLLQSFDVLDVSDAELRKELNTDAEDGIRALITPILRRCGVPLDNVKGTMPWAIISALSRRGISIMNPIRLELFSEYTQYLNDTFDAGGYAAMLAWSGLTLHWMGVERCRGAFRVMDPWTGSYKTFREATGEWDNFIVCGFVR